MIETQVITHINWQLVDIKIIAGSVKRLQNRIVKAKLAGRNRMVKKLQRLLVKSLHARILAVKRVSENRGKNTAGVDKKLLDTDAKKIQCVKDLRIIMYSKVKTTKSQFLIPPLYDTDR